MPVEIKQKRPISFGIKVALAVIVASIIAGAMLRIVNFNSNKSITSNDIGSKALILSTNILVPILYLPVEISAHEKDWTIALAKKVNGQSEVQIERGRVDVMTDSYAIEIDFFKKWHEGLGQAIHYGDESKRIGVLALIINGELLKDNEQLKLLGDIERLCLDKGVKLILLNSLKDSK